MDAEIKIYNVAGSEVKKINIVNRETVLEKDNLPDGIYFYRILGKNEIIAKGKIVIQ